ncbi:putative GTP-binding protein EngB [Candidatus Terasakiella magnetica]|uniref:Probable GTP-binding protein EngB n=1 Tax=Candidatus Terasakiella magnetica TaxID=1867952 RepID=A0A1C3RGX6_9PROT|nr:ribosome biogenesis GTP-binding protein YihA/YsxC [Candidatus Terasakiella magnetica]SCA56515.1 putative GTP-binding protein EngB [Candidatus Terasakiella magnetica]
MTDTQDFSDDEIEFGRWLFTQETDFMLGAAHLEQLPDTKAVEICFAGRSNVGKSSLINALCGRRDLARTSSTPGRTQQLNFFNIINRLVFCDQPGYGYAKAPVGEVKKWQDVVFSYLRGRPQLRRAFVLIDGRHGIKNTDRPVMEMMDTAAMSYQIIVTKADKAKKKELDKHISDIEKELAKHPAAHPDILVTSSEKGAGIAEVRATIGRLVKEFEV